MAAPRSKENSGLPRRLFVMRHGERCDFAFGRSWIARCFDEKGIFTQIDLNLPKTIIPRSSHKDFERDSPLTEIGSFQARATGEAFRKAGINIQHIYSSPSLRCVQTAQGVIDGMGNGAKMCLEPSAFEWLGWYKNCMPVWIPGSELVRAGFSINTDHQPFVTEKILSVSESVSDYYNRCHRLAEKILDNHKDDDGHILVVAHAGSLDTFTRQLRGKNPRGMQEMHQVLSSFTYCCICCVGQDEATQKWKLEQPPIPPLQDFDWKVLL